jgi:threonine dehydrogenase-like Zn-dependent dehydrogenase
MTFKYSEFTTRNIGFVTPKQQEQLKNTKVFIAGVGGMGGAALMTMVRAGIENFILVDIDTFEVSNMNRQVFCDLDNIDDSKLEATIERCFKINPNLNIERAPENWVPILDDILPKVDIVVNGCDDTYASINLMRKAKEHGKTAIDAYASLFPNVYTVRPQDPRPEEFLGYPSVGLGVGKLNEEVLSGCFQKEIEFVMTHTSNVTYIDPDIAKEIADGTRKRISFSPMVINTGTLMAYEVIRVVLGITDVSNYKGYFLNPWTHKVEKPKPVWMIFIKRYFVRKFLKAA